MKALPLQSEKMARTPPIHFERFEYCLCLSCAHHGVREWLSASRSDDLKSDLFHNVLGEFLGVRARGVQRFGCFRWIFSASLRHVRFATAAAATDLRRNLYPVAGFQALGNQ